MVLPCIVFCVRTVHFKFNVHKLSSDFNKSYIFLPSYRLWQHVSAAILQGDQVAATNEKFILEEAQRKNAKERKAKMEEWSPCLFERDLLTGDWVYKYAE